MQKEVHHRTGNHYEDHYEDALQSSIQTFIKTYRVTISFKELCSTEASQMRLRTKKAVLGILFLAMLLPLPTIRMLWQSTYTHKRQFNEATLPTGWCALYASSAQLIHQR